MSSWYVAGFLGLVGSVLVEAMDLLRLIRQNENKLPDIVGRVGYGVAVVIRLVIGFIVAAMLVEADLVGNAAAKLRIGVGAVLVLVGAGAPLILERLLAAFLALIGQSPPPAPAGGVDRSRDLVGPASEREPEAAASRFGTGLARGLVRGDWLFGVGAERP